MPRTHPLAEAEVLEVSQLAGDTWIRAHHGAAARLVDHVLGQTGLRPKLLEAGHGDEPIEAQAFVAAGQGVTLAHHLNVLLDRDRVIAVPLADPGPVRHIQAAIMRDHHSPAARAVVDPLRAVGRRHRLALQR